MDIENKYVSVIIPTYNREKTIERAIKSVLNQTHCNLELIIVDDCSQDNTEEIIKEISDERIRYLKLEKNSGANYARNKGIELSKYDLIAFQDSDDVWHEDKLEKQLKIMYEKKVDFIATSYNQFVNNEYRRIVPKEKIQANYLERILISNFIGTVTLLVKKGILIKEKFNNELPRLQDYELAIRLVKNYKGYFLNTPTVDAYIQDDSISKNYEKYFIAIKKILDIHFDLFKKNKKILSLKYLEIYQISIILNNPKDEYLFLSLKTNINYKNLIFLLLKYLKCNFIYKKRIEKL